MKSNLFVISSRESLPIARAIQENLEDAAVVTVWDQDVFSPSSYALEELLKQASKTDFAVVVATPDDRVTARGKHSRAVRDNVIFEFGLFCGCLGRKHVFFVSPSGIDRLKLPTDVLGLTGLSYDPTRSDLIAALGPACNKIRRAILDAGAPATARWYQPSWEWYYELNEVCVTIAPDVGQHGTYFLRFHKILTNLSAKPLSRVLYHFLANCFPSDPLKSSNYYRERPILWDDLAIRAWDKFGPLDLKLINDHNARKDFLIMFSTTGVDRPITQHQSREFWYEYRVDMNKWGSYVDRPITFPTRKCVVEVVAPDRVPLLVGGNEISPVRGKSSLTNSLVKSRRLSLQTHRWESTHISLGNTYQITWTSLGGDEGQFTTSQETNQRFAQQE